MKKENEVLFIISLIFPIIESDYDYYLLQTYDRGQQPQMISIYIAIIFFYRRS